LQEVWGDWENLQATTMRGVILRSNIHSAICGIDGLFRRDDIPQPSSWNWQRLYCPASKRRNKISHGNRDRSISQASGYPFIDEGLAITTRTAPVDRSNWVKVRNPVAPAVRREAEEHAVFAAAIAEKVAWYVLGKLRAGPRVVRLRAARRA
jgi:hypothetical protein